MQTSVVKAHIVTSLTRGSTLSPKMGPMYLAFTRVRRSHSFCPPAAGHQLPLQVPKKEQASVPLGRRATRVQGLSLGVFSLSPRLSALRAHTGFQPEMRRDRELSSHQYQEGKRKSELSRKLEKRCLKNEEEPCIPTPS